MPPHDLNAALRRHGERYKTVTLEDGYHCSELPHPRAVAEILARPWLASLNRETRRVCGVLSWRPVGSEVEPEPVPLPQVRDDLRAHLADLEPLPGVIGGPYNDLVHLMTGGKASADQYLDLVLRRVKADSPTWRAPHAPRRALSAEDRAYGDVERKHLSRNRAALRQIGTSLEWLGFWIRDDAPPPGERVTAPDLYAQARDVIDEWTEDGSAIDPDAEPDALGAEPAVMPTAQKFYTAADAVLGGRRKSGSNRVYTVPKEDDMARAHAQETTNRTQEWIGAAEAARDYAAALRELDAALDAHDEAEAERITRRYGLTGTRRRDHLRLVTDLDERREESTDAG